MNYETYFSELLEHEGEAASIPFWVIGHVDWEPKKNDCHGNVDHWVAHHPEAKAVRGWLFWGPDAAHRYNIMTHSAVEDARVLVDITPIDENTPREGLRFLLHGGSEEEFDAMKMPFSQLFYPFMSFEESSDGQMPIQEEIPDY